jgi:3-hydroxyacyl-[acyl-carrier-protein] dehydratase
LSITLNKNEILRIQKNKPPYLMMDYAYEIIAGKSSKGYKTLNKDEWFFKVHWEGDPNMPGMLQIEALVQICSLAIFVIPEFTGKIVYLSTVSNAKFKKKVLPNDKLNIETKILNFNKGIAKCEGTGYVNNELVCFANFTLIQPDELKKYMPNK